MTKRRNPTTSLVAVRAASAAAIVEERANESARRAWQLRQAGRTWWAIAEDLHLGEGAVKSLVADRIMAASDLVSIGARQEVMLLELARLDALQEAVWPNALLGQREYVETALKVMAARAKLLGLEAALTITSTTNSTVVVAGTSAEYVAALRQIAASTYDTPTGEQEETG